MEDDPFEVGYVCHDGIRVGAGIGGFIGTEPCFLGGLPILLVIDDFPIIVWVFASTSYKNKFRYTKITIKKIEQLLSYNL